ncbi:nucleoside-diphosphate-sugar epimerase [Sediminihabitans luteus]|uniref:Nucleoside-diphosphate-sugar epimerase n=1 Tax=Sediminihabitans luteus TaxID=1138585 RepID=A0A2M9CEA7_9CELL|nr:NAD-dependent epimerase/dehydratase family protein [Sediminihabitans luteus]PJJ70276.1 nucleoside-diphosphate-sugar epimerase [Sediminihabitans luteus]GII97747.1 nucleoside-diphosphate sugar epimerase [Sediminihabitans luteus]
MRVVVVGASGNVGTALLAALAHEPVVTSLVGVARRVPRADGSSTVRFPHDAATWVRVDLSAPVPDGAPDPLHEAFAGADVVVHLAWAVQPSHERELLRRTNVGGTRRVLDAAAEAGVRHVVLASSVGAYSASPVETPRREDWPARGITSSGYSVDKTVAEDLLAEHSRRHPGTVFTAVRSAIVVQREAASEIARYFLGPLAALPLRRDGTVPVLVWPEGLRLQVVHAADLADAYRRIVVQRQPGVFNVAADDILHAQDVADVVADGKLRLVAARTARTAVDAAWRLRALPMDPGWVDLALGAPVLDTSLARTLLRWSPTRTSREAITELAAGFADDATPASPPLL